MIDLAAKLEPYGIDYDDALDRFGGNAALYKRLAQKYLQDTHFASFVAALESGDYDEAYRQAHSLKGVAGNLSLARIYDIASMICECLRNGEPEAAAKYTSDLESAHHSAIKGLLALDQA